MHFSSPNFLTFRSNSAMKIIPYYSRLIAVCLVAVAVLSGCASSSLQEVHNTYQNEFQRQLTSVSPTPGHSDFKAEKFPETFRAITDFRQKHPSLNTANKHLTVLEALIYLQSGRYGQARLAATAAKGMPGSLTTYGGGLSRDELLLQALNKEPGLIGGWQMLAQPAPNSAKLGLAAQQLQDLSSSSDSRVVDGDDGRLYLAAVSAMLWRQQAIVDIFGGANKKETKNRIGAKITAILGPHLTPQEKAASSVDAKALSDWTLRYRYVRLYQIGKAWESL